jgi:hypothetical protein
VVIFVPQTEANTTWLLDSDPAIRWQAMRDLTGEPADVVVAERALIATEGWGSQLLKLQRPDGSWGGNTWAFDDWTSTFETLALLREFGLDPDSHQAQTAIELVRENSDWGRWHGYSPFFEGETEPCINGRVLAIGAYFGEASDRLVARLLEEQLEDGGWNCDAPASKRSSFNTTICVLEGLLEYEAANGSLPAVRDARQRGEEYLLERHLFRSLSTGNRIVRDRKGGTDWTVFSFPTRWHYDVLWGLDYLRKAGVHSDKRVGEALELVGTQHQNGRWPLGLPHAGKVHFDMEVEQGTLSRWNTLRALRVLKWFSSQA